MTFSSNAPLFSSCHLSARAFSHFLREIKHRFNYGKAERRRPTITRKEFPRSCPSVCQVSTYRHSFVFDCLHSVIIHCRQGRFARRFEAEQILIVRRYLFSLRVEQRSFKIRVLIFYQNARARTGEEITLPCLRSLVSDTERQRRYDFTFGFRRFSSRRRSRAS